MFEIEDHCYEPVQSLDQGGYTVAQLCADSCGFPDCGKSELAHAWTVGAYRNNRSDCCDW